MKLSFDFDAVVASAAFVLGLGASLGSCDASPTSRASEPPRAPLTASASATNAANVVDVAFEEHVTGGAAAADELPMLVAIHGLGDAPARFGPLFKGAPFRARLVVPRGLTPYHEGFAWFPIALRGLSPDLDLNSDKIAEAADSVAALMRKLARERPTSGKPVVTGFSQGGVLAFAIAVRHPDLVAAAFPIGGWLPPKLRPAPAPRAYPPVVEFHGEADPLVPIERARDAVGALAALGLDAKQKTYPGLGHSVSPDMRRDVEAALAAALAVQAVPGRAARGAPAAPADPG